MEVEPSGSTTYLVVNLGLELNSGLDDIDGGQSTVGDGASESTSKGESASSQYNDASKVNVENLLQPPQ